MPLKFWDEAFTSAAYLINRTPSRVINNSTPLKLLFHRDPDYSFLESLGVPVGLIYGHIIHTSLSFVQNAVLFLDTVTYIKDINVLILPLAAYIFPGTLPLMRTYFLSLNSVPMQVHASVQR